jgi:hypothetical protein
VVIHRHDPTELFGSLPDERQVVEIWAGWFDNTELNVEQKLISGVEFYSSGAGQGLVILTCEPRWIRSQICKVVL